MKIAVLPGDGIGTEIVAEAVKVHNALDIPTLIELERAFAALEASDDCRVIVITGPDSVRP